MPVTSELSFSIGRLENGVDAVKFYPSSDIKYP